MKFAILIGIFSLAANVAFTDVAFAQGGSWGQGGEGLPPQAGGEGVPTQEGGQGVSGGNNTVADSGGLTNPLAANSITEFLLNILQILLIFAMPIIVFFIIFAGFLYVTARGNEQQISRAHSAFLWAVIGGVIILGAQLIIQVIEGTVNAL